MCFSKQIPIEVRGVAVGVPVWVVQPNVDLKICMFDRLYQDSILVQSRWVSGSDVFKVRGTSTKCIYAQKTIKTLGVLWDSDSFKLFFSY